MGRRSWKMVARLAQWKGIFPCRIPNRINCQVFFRFYFVELNRRLGDFHRRDDSRPPTQPVLKSTLFSLKTDFLSGSGAEQGKKWEIWISRDFSCRFYWFSSRFAVIFCLVQSAFNLVALVLVAKNKKEKIVFWINFFLDAHYLFHKLKGTVRNFYHFHILSSLFSVNDPAVNRFFFVCLRMASQVRIALINQWFIGWAFRQLFYFNLKMQRLQSNIMFTD